MQAELLIQQKQSASAFWKAYFAKFRRRAEDHAQTLSAPLSAASASALAFPDRRRSSTERLKRFELHH